MQSSRNAETIDRGDSPRIPSHQRATLSLPPSFVGETLSCCAARSKRGCGRRQQRYIALHVLSICHRRCPHLLNKLWDQEQVNYPPYSKKSKSTEPDNPTASSSNVKAMCTEESQEEPQQVCAEEKSRRCEKRALNVLTRTDACLPAQISKCHVEGNTNAAHKREQ